MKIWIEAIINVMWYVLKVILQNLVIIAISGILLVWLWNLVLVNVLNVPYINYWQSCGIVAICNLLFTHYSFEKDKNE